MAMQTKLERLLRYHRANVLDETSGDKHHKALLRLKRTATFKAMCDNRRELSSIRHGEALARMGY